MKNHHEEICLRITFYICTQRLDYIFYFTSALRRVFLRHESKSQELKMQ